MKLFIATLAVLLAVSAAAERVPPGTTAEIEARLAPVGEVCKVGESCGQAVAAAVGGAGLGLSAEEIYNQFCFVCHTAGVAGAPKLNVVAEWEPRLAKGEDALHQSMMNGMNAMPPKGTCMGCSDDELMAAMKFMSEAK